MFQVYYRKEIYMACSKCGGYDSCQCDLLAMQEELRIKELECYALRNMIYNRQKELDIAPKKRLKFPEDCTNKDTCSTVISGIMGWACSDNIGRCINQRARDAS
jgi:hypothetical protein